MNYDTLTETNILKLDLPAEGFKLHHGGTLKEINVAYETCGNLSPNMDNVIFICHALTGDAHVAGWHMGDTKPTGWWSNMVCPGGGIDTSKFFVICANILGGCMGTTGPSSINPDTGKPYGSLFPEISVSDIAKVHKLLLNQLGYEKLYAIVGGSFGGMQALDFCTQFPGFAERCVIIASGASLTTQAIAFDVIGREAITKDANWRGGDYYEDGKSPDVGLAQARKLAHVTYLSNQMMHTKFGRRCRDNDGNHKLNFGDDFRSNFEVANYLDHQGEKFINRFDANSYLHISKAMDEFDIQIGFNSLAESLSRIQSRVLVVALSGDWLFLPEQSEELCSALYESKKDVSYFCLNAPAGHDAFLTHINELITVMSAFLTKNPKPTCDKLSNDDLRDYNELTRMIPDTAKHLLDVACSDGSLMNKIRQNRNSVVCTGVDIALDSTISALKTGNNAILGDVDKGLGIIPDNTFDCAVLSESLQVMREPDKVIDELLRIAPCAIVSFPNFGMWKVQMSLFFTGRMPKTKRLPFEWYNTPNIHLCTIRDFLDLCKSKNIVIEKISFMTTLLLSRFFVAIGLKNFGASRVLVKIRRASESEIN